MKVIVFDTHGFEREYLENANNNRNEIVYCPVGLTSQTASLATGNTVAAIFGNDDASAPTLDLLHEAGIRYLALRSAGYNHVDLDRAKFLGITVANVPSYSPHAVAEHAVALMMALNRKIVRANNRVKELNFSLDGLVGFDVYGKKAGVIGIGNIGSEAIKILHGFGCELYGCDPNPRMELQENYALQYTTLEQLCSVCDIIFLMAPLNDSTRYMINEKTISLMKNGVMLINVGRGMLLETTAVIAALKTKKIGYLGLDVYEQEKGLFFHDRSDEILHDDVIARLMTFPNVLITSHQAFLTKEALKNIAETTFETIELWEQGKSSRYEL